MEYYHSYVCVVSNEPPKGLNLTCQHNCKKRRKIRKKTDANPFGQRRIVASYIQRLISSNKLLKSVVDDDDENDDTQVKDKL